MDERLREKIGQLPQAPGVYLMRDTAGEVFYVGKAANLRGRVRSYFARSGSDARAFVGLLDRVLADVDTIVTSSDKEATLLESSLIKQHRPRYNVKLRDDKDFLCLKLDTAKAWPRLEVVRRPPADGALYFGPYHSAQSARQTLKLINKHFQLRTCTDRVLSSRKRPCLEYFIKRCPAPCVLEVDAEAYAEQVRCVAMLLGGRQDELLAHLRGQMSAASRALEYERAAIIRDQLAAVQKTLEGQRVVVLDKSDQDVIGIYREADLVEIVVLFIRAGKLVDERTFFWSSQEAPDSEIVSSFATQYYLGGSFVPEIALLGAPVGEAELSALAEVLTEKRGRPVEVAAPRRGKRMNLVRLARTNAEHAFRLRQSKRSDVESRLAQLQARLRLPRLPRRIECADVSHLGGTETVASLVALIDGEPHKDGYRTYHIKSAGAGDDYGAMRELVTRRFVRAGREEEGWEPPDLFVVDGGKGQLAVVLAALREVGIVDQPVCALAKERENAASEKIVDRVFLPGQKNPIALRSSSGALFFLARARDEAHRVARGFQERVRRKSRLRSSLTDVPGIGAKTAKALLSQLGSLRHIRSASVEELAACEGVGQKQAQAVWSHFHPASG
ncbi:MAG: excinuclease ABC subunit UvrC [Deltaproteobacteria bacterium]|nr:excinuclease ABC subunit UvrC [Deltaproteobacteria bacterium]